MQAQNYWTPYYWAQAFWAWARGGHTVIQLDAGYEVRKLKARTGRVKELPASLDY